ncbi:MAG: DedA family protein [Coriobacteriales bacterium]|nr:DedA family protein [Coriobacteriales bacterium]
MEYIQFFIDLFFNLDTVLADWVAQYGAWIYAMLFLIIFMETGLVVTPFLPGDSLLFTAGAIASVGEGLNVWLLLGILFLAAVLGDAVNYTIGRRFGTRILASERLARVIKPEYITRTQAFFDRHGGKTISLARFFPFVRTFAPFLAGVGHMDRVRFFGFNIAGGAAWVALFVGAGFFFGKIPVVEKNLELLVIGIILVSVAPGVYHWARTRLSKRSEAQLPGMTGTGSDSRSNDV